jgi:quercetin dioxygenase-like cupin family protein
MITLIFNRLVVLLTAGLFLYGNAWASEESAKASKTIRVKPIPMENAKTIIGQDFLYPGGTPQIQVFEIEIPPGQQTTLHRHAIPLFAYIASGDLELDYGSKGKKIVRSGSSFVEAINWCHFGKPLGNQSVRIIAVYLGQKNPDLAISEDCTKPD